MRSQRRLNVDNLLAKPEVLLENGHGKRHDLFVEDVLHQGLRNLCSAADEQQEWLFSPADVEEVFRRCELHGGKVHFISHISESGDNDEYLQVKGDAREAFRGLLQKGCTEKFSLVLKIPQDVVERWWKGRPSWPPLL